MKEKQNNEIFLRPRFSIDADKPKDLLLKRFTNVLKSKECNYPSKIVDNHIFIDVPKKESHFWSPQLHLEILENYQTHSALVKGLFGPKPQVWTMFMFLHFVVGTLFVGFAVLWYVRSRLDGNLLLPTIFLIILPIIWFVLYFLGRAGRNKGKSQMIKLHDFITKIIK